MQLTKKKIMVLFPHILRDINLKRDPLLIPMTLMKLGFDASVVAYDNKMGHVLGLPRIIIVKASKKTIAPERPKTTIGKVWYGLRYLPQEISYANSLNKIIKREKTDIILSYFDPLALLLVKLLNPKIKVVFKLDWTGNLSELPYPKWLIMLSFRLKEFVSDLVIVEGRVAKEQVLKIMPFLKNKIRVIPNGIPSDFFVKNKPSQRKKIVLCIARMVRLKGIDALLKGFAKATNKHREWKLRIVGPINPVQDSEYFNEMKNLAVSLGIGKRVRFMGEVSESQLKEEYEHDGIFCLASRQEGANISRNEAMAAGLPIVTTKTGGYEFVERVGSIVPIDDIDALAEALEQMIASNKKRVEAGRLGIARAKELEATTVAQMLIDELNKLDSV